MSGLQELAGLRDTLKGGGGGGSDLRFETPRDITSDVKVRVRLIKDEDQAQPILLGGVHYWGWGTNIKPIGTCPRVFKKKCLACDTFFDLIGKYPKDEGSPIRDKVLNLARNDKAYVRLVVLDEKTGEPVDGKIKIYSMGANESQSANQSAFQILQEELVQYMEMNPGNIPWGAVGGHDILLSYSPFRKNSQLKKASVYPNPGVDIEVGELPSLEDFAFQTKLTDEDIQKVLPEVFGEDYDTVVAQLAGVEETVTVGEEV